MIDTPGPQPERTTWPWVLLALLLVAGIALFFVYMPRNPGQQPAITALAGDR